MGIEHDDTQRPEVARSGVRERPEGVGDEVSLGEMSRALQYIESRVNDTHHAVNGDPGDSDDTGIKGAVQRMSHEVRSLRTLVLALIVLVALPVLAISLRAVDATGRDWGLWSPPQRAHAEARR